MEEKFFTPDQIAEKLHVSRKTVDRWLLSGELKGIKIGKFWRVKETEFENFLQSHTQGQATLTK